MRLFGFIASSAMVLRNLVSHLFRYFARYPEQLYRYSYLHILLLIDYFKRPGNFSIKELTVKEKTKEPNESK